MKFNKVSHQEFTGQKKYISLKDGESINGVVRGEIHSFYHLWENGKGRLASPDEPKAKIRFKVNFVTMEEGKLVAKIFEFPQTVYNLLADVNDEYPLEITKVKISRHGTGTDTTYNILPLAKEPISPSQMSAIKGIALNILDGKEAPTAKPGPSKAKGLPGWDEADPGPDSEGLPF